jgi:hypothetical protein
MLFLEKNVRFSLKKEEFFAQFLRDKRVSLPAICRSSRGASAKRSRREFLSKLFEINQELFSSRMFEVRKTANLGFGVFAKEALHVGQGKRIAEELSGTLEVCREEEYFKLKQDNYPSLFQDQCTQGITTGLVSLVNHSCSSPFVLVREMQEGSSRRSDKMFIQATRNAVIRTGEEIAVCYGKREELSFECECEKCAVELGQAQANDQAKSESNSEQAPEERAPKRRGRRPQAEYAIRRGRTTRTAFH